MKKTFKVLGLLFVAAFVFASCANSSSSDDDDKKSSKNSMKPLFDKDDLTEDAAKIELADGEWVIKEISEYENSTGWVNELSFTVKGKKVDESADYTYKSSSKNKIPEGFSSEEKAFYKKAGYTFDGDYMILSETFSKEDLQTTTADNSYAIGNVKYLIQRINAFSQGLSGSYKTNSDKSKYFSSSTTYTIDTSGNKIDGTQELYLAKD